MEKEPENNVCERSPTNAEMLYKAIHEFMRFIFKTRLQSALFVICFSNGTFFALSGLKLADCINGAKFIIELLK